MLALLKEYIFLTTFYGLFSNHQLLNTLHNYKFLQIQLFSTLREPSVKRKDFEALNLAGPTRENPEKTRLIMGIFGVFFGCVCF